MPEKSIIRVGCLRIADHFLAGAAQERLEKKEVELSSFEMHVVIMNAIEQVSESLLKGEIEGAFIPLPFAMELFRCGLEIKLLLFVNRGGGSIIKNNAACIKHIEDFKNKTILTPCLLSVQNMLLHKMFISAGLKLGAKREKEADVLLEVVPSNIVADVLENDSDNDIGGFVAPEPFGMQAIDTGTCKEVCKFESLWQDHPDSVFVLRDSVIKNNVEHVREIVSLFMETCKIIDQGDNDSLNLYAETFFRQDHAIVNRLFPGIRRMFKPGKCFPDYALIEIVQDYMINQAGFMSDKINIQEFIDTSFVENLRRN
ncbi:MAG: ABC transporter substrate-binding protein [Desulfobacteraceae bacterium]|nr:ABC transporter substrate-binding protein [Desulfobacteraceae bacterium]